MNKNNKAKFVTIQNRELVKREATKPVSKIKSLLCKVIGVEPREKYQYLFRIQYKGSARLKVNDVVMNEQEALFVVIREENRMAMVVSYENYSQKPAMYGKLIIVTAEKDDGAKNN